MGTTTLGGPFTKAAADETAKALGSKNHSVYSTSEGYFIERHNDIIPDRIVGLDWSTIQAMQQRRSK